MGLYDEIKEDKETYAQVRKIPGLEEKLQSYEQRQDTAVTALEAVEIDAEHALVVYTLDQVNAFPDGSANFAQAVIVIHNCTEKLVIGFDWRSEPIIEKTIEDRVYGEMYSKGIIDRADNYNEVERPAMRWTAFEIEGHDGQYTINLFVEENKRYKSLNYSLQESVNEEILCRHRNAHAEFFPM